MEQEDLGKQRVKAALAKDTLAPVIGRMIQDRWCKLSSVRGVNLKREDVVKQGQNMTVTITGLDLQLVRYHEEAALSSKGEGNAGRSSRRLFW